MTPKQEAALRQALEALEHEADIGNDNAYQRERDAIREALAEQPAQPVCPKCGNNRQVWDNQITGKKTCHRAGCHLEIEQPANVAAVNTPSERVAKQAQNVHVQPAQQQESVAVIRSVVHAGEGGVRVNWLRGFPQIGDRLYTSPPASKPWMGLTPEERDYIWHTVGNSDAHGDVDGWSGRDVMNAIEAKLKERNA